MITPAQCRAARGWLNISQADLAEMIGWSRRSQTAIARFETGKRDDLGLMLKLQNALEIRGIVFNFTTFLGNNRGTVEGPLYDDT